jgi:hypothetical protein
MKKATAAVYMMLLDSFTFTVVAYISSYLSPENSRAATIAGFFAFYGFIGTVIIFILHVIMAILSFIIKEK